MLLSISWEPGSATTAPGREARTFYFLTHRVMVFVGITAGILVIRYCRQEEQHFMCSFSISLEILQGHSAFGVWCCVNDDTAHMLLIGD